jgi:zinc transport system ATP-binding protein
MALLTCKNISLSYENKIVLADLSFAVASGDYLCIVGENGSGKSTLIKALLSLKNPAKGSILYGDGLAQNEIGYLPQQTDTKNDFPASVWEVVLSGCLNGRGLRPFYSKKDKNKAISSMKKLGILELKNQTFQALSGGQQQRVLLARALCATKKILLLDEPVSGLDPLVTNEFYSLIKQINNDGITIIMVSHDIISAVKYASHILHLQNNFIFFGNTADYLKSPSGKQFMGVIDND